MFGLGPLHSEIWLCSSLTSIFSQIIRWLENDVKKKRSKSNNNEIVYIIVIYYEET